MAIPGAHRESHGQWDITAYRKPFGRPWVAFARCYHDNKRTTKYTAEGDTLIEAVQAVKRTCDESEVVNA